MDPQITSQYIGAAFGLVVGVAALLLPWRYNPFRPKGIAAAVMPERIARQLPRWIAVPVIIVSLLVLALTPVLGAMPW